MAGMRSGVKAVQGILLGVVLLPMVACGSFFSCENKPACPATGGGGSDSGGGSGSTVDFAFVSTSTVDSKGNATSTITGYNLAAGALSPINTVTLPFVPIAMAVNPANSRLYVASVPGATTNLTPGIYMYTIATDGTLASGNNGSVLAGDLIGAMTLSPDGNYLYTMQSTGQTMIQYSVNSSTGALGTGGQLLVTSSSCVPTVTTTALLPTCSVAVSPKKDYLLASGGSTGQAGVGGTVVYAYSSTGGVTSQQPIAALAAGTASGDFSVAIDANDVAYIGQTATLSVYSLAGLAAAPTRYVPSVYTFASGTNPRSVVADSTGKFVYTANVGQGKVSGFATTTAPGVTVLTGSPFAGPATTAAVAIDSSNTYLLAAGYDATAGLQLYTIAGSGLLTAIRSVGTSTATQYPLLLAMSH